MRGDERERRGPVNSYPPGVPSAGLFAPMQAHGVLARRDTFPRYAGSAAAYAKYSFYSLALDWMYSF